VSKSLVRKRIKSTLKKCSELDHGRVARTLFDLISNDFSRDCIVGGYFPIQQEPDWRVDDRHRLWQWSFPLPDEEAMAYALCSAEELVKRSAFGVDMLVPPLECPRVVPDLLLVPGIAFGRGGERLGRGGGFFDRYLADYSGVKIGLCFEIQLEDDLPMQEHDCWMDYVITERDIYKRYHS
jgi:5-formyltetrahydrofolate cyclo-ligase